MKEEIIAQSREWFLVYNYYNGRDAHVNNINKRLLFPYKFLYVIEQKMRYKNTNQKLLTV